MESFIQGIQVSICSFFTLLSLNLSVIRNDHSKIFGWDNMQISSSASDLVDIMKPSHANT